jgi:hypothetical protein
MLNIIPPKNNGKLKPIQLKKNLRPPSNKNNNERPLSSKLKIDCEKNKTENKKNKSEKDKIFDFLKDLNLEKYTETFIDNGINTEEKIQYLNYENLKLINIPYIHCKKILSKINEISKKNVNYMERKKNELDKLNDSQYEEIILPKEEDEINENEEEQRNNFNQAIIDFKRNHTEIILENQNSTYNNILTETSEISIEEKNNNNNSLIIEVGEYVENLNNNETLITNLNNSQNKINKSKNISISTSPKKINRNLYKIDTSKPSEDARQFFPLNKSKTLCYQCLHMILEDNSIYKYYKPFCSLNCLKNFENKNLSKCSFCGKKIEIIYSIPSNIKNQTFYCSNECFKKSEPNENIIQDNKEENLLSDSNEEIIDLLE